MKTVYLSKPKSVRKTGASLSEFGKVGSEKTHSAQVEMINQIYLGNNMDNFKKVKSQLRAKLNSYKTQDKKKDRYVECESITDEQLYEKLVISKLKCNYCSNEVKLDYLYKREDFQWTLDRIDNDIGHSLDNTVVCCLKCNLQRRVTDAKKFEFTKKLKIKKKNDL